MRSALNNLRSLAAIGERLLLTREAMGLNQAELCRRTGLNPNTYNQWETGKQRPDLDYAYQLVDNLGITLDWIYLGSMGAIPGDLANKIGTVRRARMVIAATGKRERA